MQHISMATPTFGMYVSKDEFFHYLDCSYNVWYV